MTADLATPRASSGLLADRAVRLGLVGSVLLLVASWARGPYRAPGPLDDVPVLGWVRTTHLGHSLSSVLFFGAVAVLAVAWLRLGRRLDGVPVTRLWRVGALWGAPLAVGLPLASRDVYSYLAQGQLAVSGLDPYSQGPAYLPGPLLDAVSTTWWLTPAPYGPGFLGVAEAVSRVSGGGVLAGVAVTRALAVVALVATAVLLRRLAERAGVDPSRATWLALLNPLTLLHLLSGMHNEVLIVPLVLGGFVLALRGGPLAGAATVGLAAAVKVTAVVALPFVGVLWALRRGRDRVACLAAVGAAGGAVLVGLSLASGYGFTWLTAIGESTSHGSRLSLTSFLGSLVGDGVALLGGGLEAVERGASLVHLAGLLLAAAICAWLLLQPVGSADEVLRRCGLAMVAVAVLGPVFHPWYLLPGLALLAAGGAGPRTREALVWLTLFLAVVVRPGGSEVLRPEYPFDLLCAAVAFAVLVREQRAARVAAPG